MEYEINVALNGYHLFATAARSCNDSAKAAFVLSEIRERFPADRGFEVTVTRRDCTRYIVDQEELLRNANLL